MIVIFKNEKGTYSIRPAFIGFIANNKVRRTLVILYYPFILTLTIGINILQAVFVSLFLVFRSIYYPIKEVKLITKTEIWRRPRTSSDSHSNIF